MQVLNKVPYEFGDCICALHAIFALLPFPLITLGNEYCCNIGSLQLFLCHVLKNNISLSSYYKSMKLGRYI